MINPMVKLGFTLSSEEHSAKELVRQARAAEDAGFDFLTISDHFHPWAHSQHNSPFVWGVLGAIAQATSRVPIATAVTCPTIRIHPAIVAQAAATAASLMPGRFMLGVGTGENLNEHIIGCKWPTPAVRLEMLEEAIEVIRLLWQDGWHSHYGKYYSVENARIFSLAEQTPPILVAAAKKRAAQLAGCMGNGLISTAPKKSLVQAFEKAGGRGRPRYGQLTICWARTEQEARRTARKIWPNALVSGDVSAELPLPRHFEKLTADFSEDEIEEVGKVVCGPDPAKHLDAISEFAKAGFDRVFIHQIGKEQEECMRFYRGEIFPRLKQQTGASPVQQQGPQA
jgi:coenzyme F420-dependent glucose-6-phosphate dehydrogenase